MGAEPPPAPALGAPPVHPLVRPPLRGRPRRVDRPLADYPTFADFFARGLPPGARPVDARPGRPREPLRRPGAHNLHHSGGRFRQADGHEASSRSCSDRTSPTAAPARCSTWRRTTTIGCTRRAPHASAPRLSPGTLWPVFPGATTRVRELFGTTSGSCSGWRGPLTFAEVMVGAFGVGRMRRRSTDRDQHRPPGDADRARPPSRRRRGDRNLRSRQHRDPGVAAGRRHVRGGTGRRHPHGSTDRRIG